MHCPDCGHDNINGVDHCEACGQSLMDMDFSESELEQAITRETIQSLKPHTPVAIAPGTTVRDAIQGLVAKGIGCVLVEDGSEIVGIFTERDVLNRISENPDVMDRPVREFMTKSPRPSRWAIPSPTPCMRWTWADIGICPWSMATANPTGSFPSATFWGISATGSRSCLRACPKLRIVRQITERNGASHRLLEREKPAAIAVPLKE